MRIDLQTQRYALLALAAAALFGTSVPFAKLLLGEISPLILAGFLYIGSGAADASLMLNFEGVMTTLIDAMLFREAIGTRIWIAALVMLSAHVLQVLRLRSSGFTYGPAGLRRDLKH